MNHYVRLIRRHRSEILACGLVGLMLASPIEDKHPHIGGIVAVLEFGLLLLGAGWIADRTVIRRLALPVGAVWLVARLLEALGNSHERYTHLSPVAGLALSCSILIALFGKFRKVENVTSSVISEAFITYLVIAIAFSQLYWILDHFVANAFDTQVSLRSSSTFLYFSMITLSGLGYSNIFPANDTIRLLAAFENMLGLFYIAVVVSRLVSAYRAETQGDD